MRVTDVEIDYDCATSRLADYVVFLRNLRARLAPDLRLSITMLPTWLDSAQLEQALAAVDESVLQVHAVLDPALGLFEAKRARARVRAYGGGAPHGWRVALPA